MDGRRRRRRELNREREVIRRVVKEDKRTGEKIEQLQGKEEDKESEGGK